MDPARIQADTMGFADRFVTVMTAVYDALERHASTPAAKDAAHQLKTDLALGSIGNAVNPRPVAGMMDLAVYVSLLRHIAQDPWAARTFGEHDAKVLVEALTRQEADIRALASQYLSDAQLKELDGLVDDWHAQHPLDHAVSHFHLADLPEANRTPNKRGAIGASVFSLLFFDPTAHLDPTVREIELSRATSERMFFYLQRLPLLVQLQAEGFYRQLLQTPELQHASSDVSTVATSTKRFTDVVAHFPEQLAAERDQAIQQAAFALRQEQRAFVANVEAATDRSINRLLARAAAWCLACVLMIVAVRFTFQYASRRRPGPERRRDAASLSLHMSEIKTDPAFTDRSRRDRYTHD